MVNKITLDKSKNRTLSCLATKEEKHRIYPINKSDLLIVETCSLCNSRSISQLAEVYLDSKLNFFSTSVCNDCLYTFRPISPSFKWFQKCWRKISSKKLEVFNPKVEKIRKRRYEKYHELLSKYTDNGQLLDVGAGWGTGTEVFRNHGFNVEAIEPDNDKANYIENFFNIRVCANSIEEFILQKKSYDLIIFAHCLEHLDNPTFVMSHMKNLLNHKNGILYLELPTLYNYVTWSDALYLTHKSNFTEENITRLVTKSGFEILEKVQFRHTVGEPWDLGLVLKPSDNVQIKRDFENIQKKHTIDDVRKLYRKNLPLTQIPALDKVLRYNVPYIEQFFCTLRLENKKILEPQSESDFISFEPI